MRLTIFTALGSLLPTLWLVCSEPALAQAPTLLNQLEQRIQGAGPAGGAAAPETGYLGAVVDDAGEQGRGVRVISAKPGAPAAAGGLKDGDLIVAIEGKPVTGLPQLDEVLDRAVPGQKVPMTIDRGGSKQQITITLGKRPATAGEPSTGESATPTLSPPTTSPATSPSIPPATSSSPTTPPPTSSSTPSLTPPASSPAFPAPGVPGDQDTIPRGSGIRATPLDTVPAPATPVAPSFDAAPPAATAGGGASLGITVVPLTEPARSSASFPVRRGAVIAAVKPGSAADTAGLPLGGLIVRIDGRPVDSPDDLVAAIKAARPGQEVELTYYDGDRLGRKSVRLAPAGSTAGPGSPSTLVTPGGGGFRAPGGFSAAPPAPGAAVAGEPPPRLGQSPSGTRPLLQRIERMADTLTRPTGTSTVYDPLVMSALQARVVELGEHVRALEDRIKQLEGKLGVTPPTAPASAFPGPSSPGSPPAGPGFGAATGAPGTAPGPGASGTTP